MQDQAPIQVEFPPFFLKEIFRRIEANDPTLNILDLSQRKLTKKEENTLFEILNKNTSLVSLKLPKISNIDLLKSNLNYTLIELTIENIDEMDFEGVKTKIALNNILWRLKNNDIDLAECNLKEFNLSFSDYEYLCKVLAHNNNLKKIVLGSCVKFEYIEKLAKSSITQIVIDENKFEASDIEKLAKVIIENKNLNLLILRDVKVSDIDSNLSAWIEVLSAVRKNIDIRLIIDLNNIPLRLKPIISNIRETVKANLLLKNKEHNQQEFKVENVDLSDEYMDALVSILKDNNTITTITLNNVGLNDSQAEKLIEVIKDKNITHLNLKNNKIEDKNRAIFNLLKKMPDLEVDLSGNPAGVKIQLELNKELRSTYFVNGIIAFVSGVPLYENIKKEIFSYISGPPYPISWKVVSPDKIPERLLSIDENVQKFLIKRESLKSYPQNKALAEGVLKFLQLLFTDIRKTEFDLEDIPKYLYVNLPYLSEFCFEDWEKSTLVSQLDLHLSKVISGEFCKSILLHRNYFDMLAQKMPKTLAKVIKFAYDKFNLQDYISFLSKKIKEFPDRYTDFKDEIRSLFNLDVFTATQENINNLAPLLNIDHEWFMDYEEVNEEKVENDNHPIYTTKHIDKDIQKFIQEHYQNIPKKFQQQINHFLKEEATGCLKPVKFNDINEIINKINEILSQRDKEKVSEKEYSAFCSLRLIGDLLSKYNSNASNVNVHSYLVSINASIQMEIALTREKKIEQDLYRKHILTVLLEKINNDNIKFELVSVYLNLSELSEKNDKIRYLTEALKLYNEIISNLNIPKKNREVLNQNLKILFLCLDIAKSCSKEEKVFYSKIARHIWSTIFKQKKVNDDIIYDFPDITYHALQRIEYINERFNRPLGGIIGFILFLFSKEYRLQKKEYEGCKRDITLRKQKLLGKLKEKEKYSPERLPGISVQEPDLKMIMKRGSRYLKISELGTDQTEKAEYLAKAKESYQHVLTLLRNSEPNLEYTQNTTFLSQDFAKNRDARRRIREFKETIAKSNSSTANFMRKMGAIYTKEAISTGAFFTAGAAENLFEASVNEAESIVENIENLLKS